MMSRTDVTERMINRKLEKQLSGSPIATAVGQRKGWTTAARVETEYSARRYMI